MLEISYTTKGRSLLGESKDNILCMKHCAKKSNKTDRFNNKVKSLRKKQDIASYPMIYYALK